jgi:outer membrane immunogenic protein
MHKFLFGGIALALLCAAPAMAADMPIKEPIYTKAPVTASEYNWTGFYVGANAGYSFGGGTDAHISGFTDPGGFGFGPPFNAVANGAMPLTSYNTSGFLGGGQFGYNWQIARSWVVGIETDFMGGKVNGNETVVAQPACCVLNVTTVTQRLDWLGTTRARAGYAAGNWLFYGTGGLAYGKVENSLFLTLPTNAPPNFLFGPNANVQVGWAAGGGIEYGWNRWLLRAEYLHFDLGSHTVTAVPIDAGATPAGTSLSASQKASGDLVRGAISYRF